MRSSTLLTSAFAATALALPQGQLEKRQVLTVTVTTTVVSNPYATPAWAGPPKFSQTPNPYRPTNAPPLWTPPRPDAGRSTRLPGVPVPSSSIRVSSSPIQVVPSSTPGVPAITGAPVSTGVPVLPGVSSSPTSLRSSSAVVVGNPISNTPVPSNAVPTPSGVAPLDPGHVAGAAQASLSPADGNSYINSILFHHNKARANHNAAPLVWNATVASTAKITADTCRFEHYIPAGAGQGQNLFTTSGSVFNVTAGITESWYKSEFPDMVGNFGKASLDDTTFHKVGHLTQVLWKGTTSVGCYSLDCTGRMQVGGSTSRLDKYTVCNYYPAGNVATQYGINVGNPISSTNLGSWRD